MLSRVPAAVPGNSRSFFSVRWDAIESCRDPVAQRRRVVRQGMALGEESPRPMRRSECFASVGVCSSTDRTLCLRRQYEGVTLVSRRIHAATDEYLHFYATILSAAISRAVIGHRSQLPVAEWRDDSSKRDIVVFL